VLLPSAVFAVATAIALRPDDLMELGIAGAAAFMAFLLAALAYPAGMGMGDVKLAGVMGLFLGTAVIPSLFIAFLSGTIVGVAVIAKHGADGRKKGVPFGPFLAFGGLVGLLFGADLIDLYTRTFL
jgi:leader peptidase (prepilin peptidase) / N-methyltransferase